MIKDREYREYIRSGEAEAIAFIRKHCRDAKGNWVLVYGFYSAAGIPGIPIKTASFALYPKLTKPKYPPKEKFRFTADWLEACHYETWKTAMKDIETQDRRNYYPPEYGLRVKFKLDKSHYFIDSAPAEVKALANDLNDLTNPLWDEAGKYINPKRYKYKVQIWKE